MKREREREREQRKNLMTKTHMHGRKEDWDDPFSHVEMKDVRRHHAELNENTHGKCFQVEETQNRHAKCSLHIRAIKPVFTSGP